MSDTQADLLIYGVPVSPFVRKVLALAIAKEPIIRPRAGLAPEHDR